MNLLKLSNWRKWELVFQIALITVVLIYFLERRFNEKSNFNFNNIFNIISTGVYSKYKGLVKYVVF